MFNDLSGLIENLKGILITLETANNAAISLRYTGTSPLEALIEITADCLIRLSVNLKEDFRGIPTNNPELTFSERWSDPLGNPLQIKKGSLPPILGPDNLSALLMRKTAEYLIWFKRSLQVDFHGLLWEPTLQSARLYLLKNLNRIVLQQTEEKIRLLEKHKREVHKRNLRLQNKKKRRIR